MNKHLLIALIVSLCALFVCAKKIGNQNQEQRRMEGKISALMGSVEYYKTENGKSVARVERLELTRKELEKNYCKIVGIADELKVKIKRLEAASTTSTEAQLKVKTVIKDTIIYRDRQLFPLKRFDYSDSWAVVEGTITGCGVELKLQIRDTIRQVIHRVPHKFLFFRWGTKAVMQEVISSSPYTKITYTEYLEFEK